MARNQVQLQKGLGMAEFLARYGTEDQCHDALVKMRWPDGFVCPKCAARRYSFCAPKRLFQCSSCHLQTSVRAGTVFHKSRTPLTKWFLAMHLLTGSKNDIASLELARQLDVKWDTAWLIKQKLMEVTVSIKLKWTNPAWFVMRVLLGADAALTDSNRGRSRT